MTNPIPFATHSGILKLGELELRCFVLNNKDRVIIMRDVVKLLTGNAKGGLERYINAKGVRQHMPEKYGNKSHKDVAIVFTATQHEAYGYRASDIVDIFKGYIKAREANTLLPSQEHLAVRAETFINASSKLGLDAYIDEATGYQDFRDSLDLQARINAYLQDEYREWTRTFPRVFFDQLFILEGKKPPALARTYPKRFGKYVMNYVYDTLDEGIAQHLREINPNPSGEKHHWQLFNDVGYKKLTDHLMAILGILKASQGKGKDYFERNLLTAFPNWTKNKKKRQNENKPENIKQGEFQFL
jgi:hypothetical protein